MEKTLNNFENQNWQSPSRLPIQNSLAWRFVEQSCLSEKPLGSLPNLNQNLLRSEDFNTLSHWLGNTVGLGIAVNVGIVVGVAGTGVLVGTTVIVKGRAVSVNGSVGYGVTVLPGNNVG